METMEVRRTAAAELRSRINRLQTVSPDTAYREGFNLAAMEKSISAEEKDQTFFSAVGAKGVLVLGISALGADKAASFIAACGGWKSHANSALLALDGERGEIRRNSAGTCWVIDLASPRRVVMFAWTSGPGQTRLAGPRLNTTNGAAHWCGILSALTPIDPVKSPVAVAFIQKAMACEAEHGMTPLQWERSENSRKTAENDRCRLVLDAARGAASADGVRYTYGGYGPQFGQEYRDAASAIAGKSGPVPANLAELVRQALAAERQAADEARLMAELEAEQARLAAEKTAAEAAAKQAASVAAICRVMGIAAAVWGTMSPKQQGLALHRARLAHLIL